MNAFFLKGIVEMESYFIPLPYIMIFFLPALSMRLWSEERRDNTYELLMTLPIKTYKVVLGKFWASFIFFAIILLGTLPIVIMLAILGEPDYGRIVASYLGTLFLGAFYLCIGIFLSGITKDQIVAYLLTIMATFIFYFSGNELAVSIIDGLWPALKIGSLIRENFSALPHFETFLRGIIDLRSIIYFSILGLFFLWINHYLTKKVR
jgi:ABC-type transport system involved in multi-copper enzyme maturation permease subunit